LLDIFARHSWPPLHESLGNVVAAIAVIIGQSGLCKAVNICRGSFISGQPLWLYPTSRSLLPVSWHLLGEPSSI
jgi:hypothetical protein